MAAGDRLQLLRHHEIELTAIRQKHPARSSVCGALLSEVRSASATTHEQNRAAFLLDQFACRRGLKVLERLAWSTRDRLQLNAGEEDSFITGEDRYLFSALLYAIARIDSTASHASLRNLYSSMKNIELKSDVLEAMAFESEMFDMDFVLDVLAKEAKEPILLSALYAVMFHASQVDSTALRKALRPFLRHESGNLRMYAVRAFGCSGDRRTRALISKLKSDTNADVRDAVADALRRE